MGPARDECRAATEGAVYFDLYFECRSPHTLWIQKAFVTDVAGQCIELKRCLAGTGLPLLRSPERPDYPLRLAAPKGTGDPWFFEVTDSYGGRHRGGTQGSRAERAFRRLKQRVWCSENRESPVFVNSTIVAPLSPRLSVTAPWAPSAVLARDLRCRIWRSFGRSACPRDDGGVGCDRAPPPCRLSGARTGAAGPYFCIFMGRFKSLQNSKPRRLSCWRRPTTTPGETPTFSAKRLMSAFVKRF